MWATRLSWFIKFEDSNNTIIENKRVIDEHMHIAIVAKFMSHAAMTAYFKFQDNYNMYTSSL